MPLMMAAAGVAGRCRPEGEAGALALVAGTLSLMPGNDPASSYEMAREEAVQRVLSRLGPTDIVVSTTGGTAYVLNSGLRQMKGTSATF